MAIMDLMDFSQTTLPPTTTCQVYIDARPNPGKSATKDPAVLQALWDNCGTATIEVIAAGAVTLAALWEAAFTLSGASNNSAWLKKVYDGPKNLQPIYEDLGLLRSLHLQFLGQSDLPGSDAPVNPPPPPSTKKAAKKLAKKAAKKSREK